MTELNIVALTHVLFGFDMKWHCFEGMIIESFVLLKNSAIFLILTAMYDVILTPLKIVERV